MNKKDMNDRLPEGRLALRYTILEIGFWGYACSTFGYEAVFLEGRGISTGIGQYYLCQALQMLTFGLLVPATVRYAEEAVAPEDQFKGQAYMALTNTIGCAVGSMIGGTLLEIAGTALVFRAGLAFSLFGFFFIWSGDRM